MKQILMLIASDEKVIRAFQILIEYSQNGAVGRQKHPNIKVLIPSIEKSRAHCRTKKPNLP